MLKSEQSSAPVTRPWSELFASSPPPGVGARLGIDYARASSGPLRLRPPRHSARRDFFEDCTDDCTRESAEIVIQQDETRPGLFSVAWDCALVAAGLIMRRCPNLVRGKRILELGSGTGIVGICAGYAGASFAVLSDASVSDLLRANAGAAARACGPVFETIEYCWGDDVSGLIAPPRRGPPEVVLCSDLLYEPASMPALLASLRDLATVIHAGAFDSGCCDVMNDFRGREREQQEHGAPGGYDLVVLIVFKRRNDSAERSFFADLSETFDLEELMLEESSPSKDRLCSLPKEGAEGAGDGAEDAWCGLAERSRRGVHAVVGRSRLRAGMMMRGREDEIG